MYLGGASLVVFSLGVFPLALTSQQTFTASPATQDPAVRVTMEQIARWERELSNWGRWGPADQKGTLNLITPEKTRQAASLVRDGVTVTLSHFVSEEEAMDSQTFAPTDHWMTSVDPATGLPRFALDAISFSLHDDAWAYLCLWLVRV
jgi:hypothetical protein